MKKIFTLLFILATSCVAQGINSTWSKDLGSKISSFTNYNNNFYTIHSNVLTCFNENGLILWDQTLTDTAQAFRATEHGVVISGLNGQILLVGFDGVIKSMFNSQAVALFDEALDVTEDTIIVGSRDGQVYLFQLNGTELWNYRLGGYVIAVDKKDNEIRVISDKLITRLDVNGTLIEEKIFDGFIRTIAQNNHDVIIASNTGVLWYLNDSMDERWGYGTGSSVGVLAINDEYVVSGDQAGVLNVFHLNGTKKLQLNQTSSIVSTAISPINLALGTLDGQVKLYGINGGLQREYALDSTPVGLFIENNSLSFTTSNGEIHYVRLSYYSSFDAKVFILTLLFFILLAFYILFKNW